MARARMPSPQPSPSSRAGNAPGGRPPRPSPLLRARHFPARFGGSLAAALLAALMFLLAGAPAHAQTVAWNATLTSADNWALGSTYTYDGYGSSALGSITTTQGSLSPDSFTVGTTTHTVELLGVRGGSDNRLYLLTDTGVSKSDLAGHSLEITVGGSTTTMKVSDATNAVVSSTNVGIYWAASLHSFGPDDWQAKTITVKLLLIVPGAPTSLTTTPGHRAVVLHWTAPAADGGSPITGYEIQRNTNIYATGSTDTSYLLDNFDSTGIYRIEVRAINANGKGAWSDFWVTEVHSATVTIAGGSDVLEGQEAEFTLTADRPVLSTSRPLNVSVLVSGQQHHLEDGTQSLGVKTVSFGLNATTAAHSVQTRQDYAATGDSDLTAAIQTSTDYTVGNPSSATVKITERNLVPDPPTDLVVTHTHFDVNLSWTAPAFPGTHGSPIWYEIDLGELRSSIRNVTGTSQKELFGRINVVYSASIRVRATNGYGEGEWSDQVLFTLRGAAITIAGNGPVIEGSDAVFTLTTDLINRQKINGINTLAVNVLVSETDDMVASTAEKVYTVRFADDATTATLTVPTEGDDRDERDSVVTATIQPSTETTLVETYETGSLASATVTVANDDVGNFERQRLDSCGVSAPHSSGHSIECFQLVSSSHVRTPEGMAARGYKPIGIKQPEVGDIVAMEGLPSDWVISVLGAKEDDTVVTVAAGTSPVTEGANVMFTVTRATAATTHLSVTVGVAETQSMIFNGVPDSISSARWPTRVDILANATDATFLVVTEDDDLDETDSVITATVNARNGYTVGTSGSASVTVEDNDGTAQQQQTRGTPDAPKIFIATANGPARVDLIWTTPESGAADGYEIEWSADGETGWQAVEPPDDGGDTMYRHVGLTPRTTYY